MDLHESQQYGLEATFVSDIPEYLTCAACKLVLRDPLQISKCGHKLCSPCFERLKTYSREENKQLTCPVDRKTIDVVTVFEDMSTCMMIGGLSVKCSCCESGCDWVGEFSNLSLHEGKCPFKVRSKPSVKDVQRENETMKSMLRDMSSRMAKYQSALESKDKDFAHMKFSIEDMKLKFDAQNETNRRLEEEVKQLKANQKDVSQLELTIENLGLKNAFLEQKVAALESQLKDATDGSKNDKQQNDKQQNELDSLIPDLKTEIEEMKASQLKMNADNVKSLNMLSVITQLRTSINLSSKDVDERMEGLNSRLDYLEECLMDHECQVSNGTKLLWKVQNYSFCEQVGASVYSPVFNTELIGFRFQLCLEWDRCMGAIGVFLILHRADPSMKNRGKLDNSFDIPFVLKSRGLFKSDAEFSTPVAEFSVTSKMIDANRDANFTIYPDQDRVGCGFGAPRFIKEEAIGDFIVDDAFTVTCCFDYW